VAELNLACAHCARQGRCKFDSLFFFAYFHGTNSLYETKLLIIVHINVNIFVYIVLEPIKLHVALM
jgi:hypothetical protein